MRINIYRMIERIKARFNRFKSRMKTLWGQPVWKDKAEAPIVHAFTCGGTDYYKFKDINNLMSGRAFAVIDYFDELSMKCDRDYLLAHCTLMTEQLNGVNGEVNLNVMAKQVMQLKERLDMILDPDIILKIASVVYFDSTEQPWAYDFQYNHEKIKKWKADKIDGFFLKKSFQDLLPGISLSDKDFQSYTKVARLMTKEHLADIFMTLSTKNENEEWYKRLKSQSITA